jgi:hypothetical protein
MFKMRKISFELKNLILKFLMAFINLIIKKSNSLMTMIKLKINNIAIKTITIIIERITKKINE